MRLLRDAIATCQLVWTTHFYNRRSGTAFGALLASVFASIAVVWSLFSDASDIYLTLFLGCNAVGFFVYWRHLFADADWRDQVHRTLYGDDQEKP